MENYYIPGYSVTSENPLQYLFYRAFSAESSPTIFRGVLAYVTHLRYGLSGKKTLASALVPYEEPSKSPTDGRTVLFAPIHKVCRIADWM